MFNGAGRIVLPLLICDRSGLIGEIGPYMRANRRRLARILILTYTPDLYA
ncbi:hypothetical protein SAMN04488512_1088 [Sulfitobacter litoralis]|jgi:hypothetical protein|uniref:Uncharacterized protein n=1 Tax=Sulfitobacter litoralis TaxID=335975 RepID=A0ABY0SAC8_9RHOB|nr:hypothetical protein SAMN04488512_1088 [Sulfitobacter litoralis]